MGTKKVWEGKEKELGEKLKSMEKFLGTRNLKKRVMLWESQKGNNFPYFWTVNLQPQDI